MTSEDFDNPRLRDAMRSVEFPTELNKETIDVTGVQHRVSRAASRRATGQRVALGTMALALIGGLTFGMIGLFKQAGDAGVLVASPVASEISCGASFVAFSYMGATPYLKLTPAGAAAPGTASDGEELRDITGYSDFDTWLVNPADAAPFVAGSTGYSAGIVVQESRIIAIPGPMPQPWTEHNLAPAESQQVSSGIAELCEGESYGAAGEDEFYAILDTTTEDGVNQRIWSEPITFSEPLTNPFAEVPSGDDVVSGGDSSSSNGNIQVPPDAMTHNVICTFRSAAPESEEWDAECPFTIQSSLKPVMKPYDIEEVLIWVSLDTDAYQFIHGSFGGSSLPMEVRDSAGDVVIPEPDVMTTMMSLITLSTKHPTHPLSASSQAGHYDWDGLPAGEYTAHFRFGFSLEAVEHNPNFNGLQPYPEVTHDPASPHGNVHTIIEFPFQVTP